MECHFILQWINTHIVQHIILSTNQFPVTQTSIAISPAHKHIFPILSGQWKEIMLSGMPLHIPVDWYTYCATYNIIHRSVSSDPDINSHLFSTNISFWFYPVNGKKLCWVECPSTFQQINTHVAQHVIWSTDQFPVTKTSIAISPTHKHIFPILSGQWKEIMLSGMLLHIPKDQYTHSTI